MKRNIIVFGSTGKTGNRICEELERKDLPYSVFVREPSKNNIKHSPISILTGDVLSGEDVQKALNQASYSDVIIALGSRDLKNPVVRSQGTKTILDALKINQSSPAIHVISSMGVGESWNQLNWFSKLISRMILKNVLTDHQKQEEYVMNSSLPYHIVRPVGLQDGPPQGEILVQNEGIMPGNAIQRADVARYLVESLLENKQGVSGICQKSTKRNR